MSVGLDALGWVIIFYRRLFFTYYIDWHYLAKSSQFVVWSETKQNQLDREKGKSRLMRWTPKLCGRMRRATCSGLGLRPYGLSLLFFMVDLLLLLGISGLAGSNRLDLTTQGRDGSTIKRDFFGGLARLRPIASFEGYRALLYFEVPTLKSLTTFLFTRTK